MTAKKQILREAFRDVRSTSEALEWEVFGNRSEELVERLARLCVLAGLRAVADCFGGDPYPAVANIARNAAMAIEQGRIVVMGDYRLTEDPDAIVGPTAATYVDPCGRAVIGLTIPPAWISEALTEGYWQRNLGALASLIATASVAEYLVGPERYVRIVAAGALHPPASEGRAELEAAARLPGVIARRAMNLARLVVNVGSAGAAG